MYRPLHKTWTIRCCCRLIDHELDTAVFCPRNSKPLSPAICQTFHTLGTVSHTVLPVKFLSASAVSIISYSEQVFFLQSAGYTHSSLQVYFAILMIYITRTCEIIRVPCGMKFNAWHRFYCKLFCKFWSAGWLGGIDWWITNYYTYCSFMHWSVYLF